MLKVCEAEKESVLMTPLYYSVKRENTDIVNMLISQGADVNLGRAADGGGGTGSGK